jgi:iron complex transport system substrate-binding protein
MAFLRSHSAIAGFLGAACLCGISTVAPSAEITFEDQRGKLITLAEPADSVVALPKPVPAMFIGVDGGTEHLTGMHPAAKAVLLDSVLGRFFPGIAGIDTSVVADGFIPNVEEMLKVNPDVVMQWARRTEDYIDPLEKVGLTVVGLDFGSHEIERGHIEIVGQLLGKTERIASFLSWQDEVIEQIKQKLADVPTDQRARMVFFDRYRSDELAVFGRNEFFFQAPGLRNLAFEAGLNQATVTVDAEQVLAWQPDIIFLNYYDLAATPANMYADPVLASVPAIQNRRVYKTPRLDPSELEAPLVWMWMAMLAYPDLFDWDLRALVKEKYTAMYGQSPSDAEIDTILHFSANADSAHYKEMFGQ